MLRRILIANRGEIAARIVAACQRLGIETVLAASEADLDSRPARLADRTICLGPPPAAASYLNVAAVVAAAAATGCDAIHPGYGFLAENPALARACAAAGLVFIGPAAAQLELAGDKLAAREQAAAAGLPVLPGGEVATAAQAQSLAADIGWPILIKAAGGGGGRGLRPVHSPAELAAAAGRLLDHPELRADLSAAASAAVRDYDWPVVARDVVRVYEAVVPGVGRVAVAP